MRTASPNLISNTENSIVDSLLSQSNAATSQLGQDTSQDKQQAPVTDLSDSFESVLEGLVGLPLHSQRSSQACGCASCAHSHEHMHFHGSLPEGASEFASVGRNGQRIDNGRNFTTSPLKWTRSDGKSDGRGATVVTFAFDDNFDVNGVGTDKAKSLFIDALQVWSQYAPIDFVEEKDPGSGDRVDILVQSDTIDGRGNTLAFAFFPTVGDITFDTGEDWNQNTFLETATHELGHALGLDHENDVDAIMNSVLGRRFTNGKAFLLEDDIQGIRSLYGSGKGSVQTLNRDTPQEDNPTQPAEQPSATNLLRNGSFEDVPLSVGSYGVYSQINGWSTISGVGFQVDRRPNSSGQAADGTAWVELDVYGQNSTIGQNIDTVTGQQYNVSVDFSDGGRPEWTTSVQVFWEGRQIDTLSGGGRGEWRRFNYTLTGGDRNVSTLAFRAIGPNDSVGGFIDNIVVSEARESLLDAEESRSSTVGASIQPNASADKDPITGEDSGFVVHNDLSSDFYSQHMFF